jgi:hypothetical protein
LVGTSGVDVDGNELKWFEFFGPIKRAHSPGHIVVLVDICWGTSPTIAAVWTTPPDKRPAVIFGPARSASRPELDAAAKVIVDHLAKHGIPDVAAARRIVDGLNSKYPPAESSGTPFYRAWYWEASGLKRYP